MMAREVRNYLEELKLKEDLLRMMTKHSLEVNVSFSLKPLADAMKESNEASSEADDQVADDSDHSGTSSENLHGKTAD
jgi:hypothetical protein